MKTLAANSVDSIVTDAPYGLSKQPKIAEVLKHWLNGDDYTATGGGFMGKTWDSFVPGPLTWAEAYRILKPGGYCVVFAGSRTVDLMAISLRIAGFEVVDMLHWMYGSGFPKSLDISKAIDAYDAVEARTARAYAFTEWFKPWVNMTNPEIDRICGTKTLARHWTDCRPNGKQPEVITREHFERLRPYLTEPVPAWVEVLIEARTVESQNTKNRKIVGHHEQPAQASEWRAKYEGGVSLPPSAITEPHTEEAKNWEGFGTALKPAHEPIILCRKPLDGTYANNVLKHGAGALNINGCRVEGGRWPGNVLHDGCLPDPMDRYFYSAKASKADREAGLELFDMHTAGEVTGGRQEGSDGLNSPRSGAGRTSGAKNIHPTVKPTELMRWLCRLVTPPGGLIVDPFTGSGSTGRGAALEGFGFLGFELDAQYAEIARARIEDAKK
jgi:DNA modification methylase